MMIWVDSASLVPLNGWSMMQMLRATMPAGLIIRLGK